MNIISLSMNERGFIVCLAFINLTLVTICVMMNIAQQKHKKNIMACLVIFIVNSLNLAALLEIHRECWYKLCDKMSPLGIIVNGIPHYFQYIFMLANISFAIYEFYNIRKSLKREFSVTTVREAIENLPTGLAFYDESGFLYLSNHIIHKLSIELTTKDLQNGLELIHDITVLQDTDICEIRGEEPAFRRKDGSIWQFSQSVIEIDDRSFIQLRADDITEIYHLSDEIRETNERLKLEKIRLAEHMKNIGEYISEEETLRVKMAVHDDFGELIARTVRAYERKASREEKAEVITEWSKLGQKMNRILTFSQKEINSLERIMTFANELDCKVEFIGTLPDQYIYRELILAAAFESLKNAVHHAKADEVIVTIMETEHKITASIYNEDKTNPKQITEGGGLTTLREKVEKAGGMMEIICSKGVTLCITLHKEVNINV